MTAESSARSHAEQFRWWLGCPELSDDEARMQDLLALRSAAEELIREQRDLLGHYDTDAELFGEQPDGPLVFPTAESHSPLAVLLPATEQQIAEAHAAAASAAHGDSNDEEIERRRSTFSRT
ncbi:hypothetical protein [Leucobacter chromiireducens]|uniref:hypothetical protein n=1 Tax=Leucobacter chromiireducens TaxID=283877 RepID=UPI0019D1AB95|nr:hypothetical protein [Leucobacter chromiireducens]